MTERDTWQTVKNFIHRLPPFRGIRERREYEKRLQAELDLRNACYDEVISAARQELGEIRPSDHSFRHPPPVFKDWQPAYYIGNRDGRIHFSGYGFLDRIAALKHADKPYVLRFAVYFTKADRERTYGLQCIGNLVKENPAVQRLTAEFNALRQTQLLPRYEQDIREWDSLPPSYWEQMATGINTAIDTCRNCGGTGSVFYVYSNGDTFTDLCTACPGLRTTAAEEKTKHKPVYPTIQYYPEYQAPAYPMVYADIVENPTDYTP